MRRHAAVLAALVGLFGTAACDGPSDPPAPSTTAANATPSPADVSEHESGPDSPIAYGLRVPKGATQLGPLVRFRSPELIAAYQPELDAALAQQEAEEQRKRAEAEANGTPLPPTTTPTTPSSRPSDDTFKLIGDPPKPDTTISLMRVDGSPTEVVRLMLAQIDTVMPDANLVLDDLSEYCPSVNQRIKWCHLLVTGTSTTDRELQIELTVDPGNLKTRTSPPSAKENPVMVLRVAYVGDPRRGQVDRKEDGDVSVPHDIDGEDTSGLIWPKMDVDAPPTTELLNGWKAPEGATILLSGRRPEFVALVTDTAVQADDIAASYAATVGEPTKDVSRDLNELSTTYMSEDKKGNRALATYVLSARGNYAMLFYRPAEKKPKSK